MSTTDFIPGAWIQTEFYGAAVLLETKDGWAHFRYEATRGADGTGETLWVQNGEPLVQCSYLKPPDETSLHVLTLTGPYGKGI